MLPESETGKNDDSIHVKEDMGQSCPKTAEHGMRTGEGLDTRGPAAGCGRSLCGPPRHVSTKRALKAIAFVCTN